MTQHSEYFLYNKYVDSLCDLLWELQLEIWFLRRALQKELFFIDLKQVYNEGDLRVILSVVVDPGCNLRLASLDHVFLSDLSLDLLAFFFELIANTILQFLLQYWFASILLLQCHKKVVIVRVVGCVFHLQVLQDLDELLSWALDQLPSLRICAQVKSLSRDHLIVFMALLICQVCQSGRDAHRYSCTNFKPLLVCYH